MGAKKSKPTTTDNPTTNNKGGIIIFCFSHISISSYLHLFISPYLHISMPISIPPNLCAYLFAHLRPVASV